MYGMTETKIQKAKYKVKCNKAFMKSHGIIIDNNIIPFSDFVSNSYVNSDRYIAELQHRAHSINDYAKEKGLSNIFLTLTLPSVWHPMKQKSQKDKTQIFNKKFGGRKYITKIKHPKTGKTLKLLNTKEMIKKYQPRGASAELSKMLKKIQDTREYKNIEKDDRCYFRVTEPHKDGTPHLHISLFVPENAVDGLVKVINSKFPAPASKIVLNVDSPVHYLMKYILKTLDDLRKDDNKLTSLSLWYVYHGISRFYTSRTFVSLDIYRSLKGLYTLEELTSSYNNNEISVYLDTKTSKVVRIDNAYSTIYQQKVIKETFNNPSWRKDMENEDNTYFEYEYDPIKVVDKVPVVDIYEFNNEQYIKQNGLLVKVINESKHGKTYQSKHGLVIEPALLPSHMNDIELYEYYQSLDIETVTLARYGNIRNMCIERGLIDGEIVPLKEYITTPFEKRVYQMSYKYYSANNIGLIDKNNFAQKNNYIEVV